jgi:hypothetical protein
MTKPYPMPPPTAALLANKVPNETHKAFKLLSQPFDPPEEVLAWCRPFLARQTWTFSRTMPQWPHEYIVRDRLDADDQVNYDAICRLVQDYGYTGRFGRHVRKYMNCDGWRYWQIENVLNRALNDDLSANCCALAEATGGKHHAKTCANREGAG